MTDPTIIAKTVEGIDPEEIGSFLYALGVWVRAGNMTEHEAQVWRRAIADRWGIIARDGVA